MLVAVCILLILFPYYGSAKENLSPVSNTGKKWRIGYFQGSEYYEFRDQLKATIDSLIDIGWIKPLDIPDEETITANDLWSWLSINIKSDYIEFVGNAFWSNAREEESCKVNKEDIYERAVKEKYIDLMIAMGTVAGECLSKKIKGYNVNTMVMCASNPILSEIVKSSKSPEYSGVDYIHAEIEQDEFYNEINLFYKLVHFKKLGIVYQDTIDEKVYAAIEEARRAEKKYKFRLIPISIPAECNDEKCRKQELEKKYNEISTKVDAIYITEHMEESEKNIYFLQKLLNPIFDHKVATWSQTPKTWMVKYGVLMSLEGAAPADVGMFEAKVMAQILRGKKPGEISQLFVNPKNESIILNLETAQKIQLDLKWEALATAEKIYEKTCKDMKDNSCEKEQ